MINDRFSLAQYCLRALGAPVVRVNITEDQIDDRIDDALDIFINFHMDGAYREVYVHTITQEEIDNRKFKLPSGILSIIGVYLPSDPSAFGANNGNLQMQAYFSDLISQTYSTSSSAMGAGVSSYAITQNYLSTFNSVFNHSLIRVTVYKVHQESLTIPDFRWDRAKAGDIIGLDCFKYDDPDDVGSVYNDPWLKQYATALIKKQWAVNIGKFSNIPLVGGGMLNGEALLQQALQEISELELKLKDQYSLPIQPFMG